MVRGWRKWKKSHVISRLKGMQISLVARKSMKAWWLLLLILCLLLSYICKQDASTNWIPERSLIRVQNIKFQMPELNCQLLRKIIWKCTYTFLCLRSIMGENDLLNVFWCGSAEIYSFQFLLKLSLQSWLYQEKDLEAINVKHERELEVVATREEQLHEVRLEEVL